MNTPASPAGARHRAAIRHKARVAALLGAVAALTTACGSQGAASHTASAGGAATKPTSSLTISVAAARGDTPRHWTLTCGHTAGGTLPHPAAACAALARAKDPFAPVPRGIMCSMIDSGPQTAFIAGTWRGTRVASAYSRLDSCETARWNKLWKVFSQVNPGGVNPGGPMIRASGAPPSN